MEGITNRLIDQSSHMMTLQGYSFFNQPPSQSHSTPSINSDTTGIDGIDGIHNSTTSVGGNAFFAQTSQFMFMTMTMMFSTLFASMMTMLVPFLMSGSNNIAKWCKLCEERIGCRGKIHEILLESIVSTTDFGKESTDMSKQKKALLHVLQKHIGKYKDLYKLKETRDRQMVYNSQTGYDEYRKEVFYEINQFRPITIYKKGKKYLKIKCYNDEITNDENDNRSRNRNSITSKKVYHLSIVCNYGLKPIQEFIANCMKEWEEDIKNDKKRYMFTYLGLDNSKQPIYEKDDFVPYAHFDGLVGDVAKTIQGDFKFFCSEKGEEWHKSRNLPYQKTHCYYGEPGTGKSIIACAIAQQHNLHVVRIRLSEIEDNTEFIKVLRNKEYGGTTIEYKDILYLFDEFDTQLEKLEQNDYRTKNKTQKELEKEKKNEKKKYVKIKNNFNDSEDSDDDNSIELKDMISNIKNKDKNIDKEDMLKQLEKVQSCMFKYENKSKLSIGVILEELNGINQMYGRKMIIITNKIEVLKRVHRGAFVRPGRIDYMIELKRLTQKDIMDLLELYYPIEQSKRHIQKIKMIKDYEYTPAFITNICKISKTVYEFVENLKKHSN